MAPLLPPADARRMIVAALTPVASQTVSLNAAVGRVLRADAVARVAHPPADVSAMDGYAIRFDDIGPVPHRLKLAGESAAGHPWTGVVQAGEAVRIFTGAHLPAGADTVVIQENTTTEAGAVILTEAPEQGRHIRGAGQDFAVGDLLLKSPRRLTARDVGLLGAMNLPQVQVARRPRIGVLSTGDEIVMPGEPAGPGQVVSANGPGLCALVRALGAEDIHLGIVRDEIEALRMALDRSEPLDLLVTSGGVSVGDHDLMGRIMQDSDAALGFHKIAIRPGKPLLFGTIKGLPLLGLPGNPVSAMVCAVLFLRPAVERLMGLPGGPPRTLKAILGADLAANDLREDYLRATLETRDGDLVATPFPKQDSAMLATFANADALLVRPPHAAAARAGDKVTVIPLDFDR